MDFPYFFWALTAIVSGGIVKRPTAAFLMYSDLLNSIGDNRNCSSLWQQNTLAWQPNTTDIETDNDDAAVALSRLPFLKQNTTLQDGSPTTCVQEDASEHDFLNYEWVCVSTGNGSTVLHNSDWLFLNCTTGIISSTVCLSDDAMREITRNVCENETSGETCPRFRSVTDEKQYTCSREFSIERRLKDARMDLSWSMAPLDLAACLCGGFILVAFLLAVCIPERACRLNYQSESESGLRVPLEIYEMYGVKYRPSAKKKHTKTTDGWIRRMSRRLMPHSRNLAIVASLDDLTKRNQLSDCRGHDHRCRSSGLVSSLRQGHSTSACGRDSIPVVIVDDVTAEGDSIKQHGGDDGDGLGFRGHSLDLGRVSYFDGGHVNDSFVGDDEESPISVEVKNNLRSVTSEVSLDYSVASDKTEDSVMASEERRHSVC